MPPTPAHSPEQLGMPAPRPRSREPAAAASIGCSDSPDPDAAAGETTPLGQAALGSDSAICAGWREHLTFVTPETVVRWHRQAGVCSGLEIPLTRQAASSQSRGV